MCETTLSADAGNHDGDDDIEPSFEMPNMESTRIDAAIK